MLTFIKTLANKNHYLTINIIGQSAEGRLIPLLIFSKNKAHRYIKHKPSILIVGQQHGNEPGGGEVALAVAASIAEGELKSILNDMNILIIPRANPDGSANFVRTLKNGIDLNREHLLLQSKEAIAIAHVLNQYHPEIVIDCHEFSVAKRWLEKFNVLQAYDVMLEYATVLNYPPVLTNISKKIALKIQADLAQYGFSSHTYYTTSYDIKNKHIIMGGFAPDTLRNAAGLRNSVSFLIETRGVNIGLAHYKRRVASGYIAVKSILNSVTQHSQKWLTLIKNNRKQNLLVGKEKRHVIIKAKPRIFKRNIIFIHPFTGKFEIKSLEWESSLYRIDTLTRSSPIGYLLPASVMNKKMISYLKLLGVMVLKIKKELLLVGEEYVVLSKKTEEKKDVRGISLLQISSYETALKKTCLRIAKGDYYIPFHQGNSNLISAILEPEGSSSMASLQLITPFFKSSAGMWVFPIYRIEQKSAMLLR